MTNGKHLRPLCAALLAFGCYTGVDRVGLDGGMYGGSVGSADDGATGSGGESESETESETGGTQTCPEFDVVSTQLRRLTNDEYRNTVRDLLEVDAKPAMAAFPHDGRPHVFASNEQSSVAELGVDQYMVAAEAIADDTAIEVLGACVGDEAVDAEVCATQSIDNLLQPAFRRPVDAPEVEAYATLWADERDADGITAAYRHVLTGVLQSPHFLYRFEHGEPDGNGGERLSAHELSVRLSYFLWSSMPDAELRAAADDGRLLEAAELRTQSERMLADPRAGNAIASFHRQLFRFQEMEIVDKSEELYPQFNSALAEDMLRETDLFTSDVVLQGGGRLRDLLTAPYSLVNAPLAELYGLDDAVDPGEGFARVDFPDGQRRGLLTQAAFLALHSAPTRSSPTKRGEVLRSNLLCQIVQEAADDAQGFPPPDPSVPPRENWERHVTDPQCNVCHGLTDPLGFPYEHYDAVGAWRDTIGVWPVDATAQIRQTDFDGQVDGALDLAEKLATSEQVHRCVADRWVEFAAGRRYDEAEACEIQAVADAFVADGGDIRALIERIVNTEVFSRFVPAP